VARSRTRKEQAALGIGDYTVTMPDHEMTRCLADVNAVVAVGGITYDSLILFVGGVHSRPCTRIRRRRGSTYNSLSAAVRAREIVRLLRLITGLAMTVPVPYCSTSLDSLRCCC